MTTTFDSFDSSAHGAFVESPLGVRNTPHMPWQDHVLVMMFIDEAISNFRDVSNQGYVNHLDEETEELTAAFDSHVSSYLDLRSSVFNTSARQLITAVMHVKQLQPAPGFYRTIVPPSRLAATFRSRSDPNAPFVRVAIPNRPPQLSRLITAFNELFIALPDLSRFVSVLLLVDGSGSMNGGEVLEPTLSAFASVLRADSRVAFQGVEIAGAEGSAIEFFDEQWVRFVTDQVQLRILR